MRWTLLLGLILLVTGCSGDKKDQKAGPPAKTERLPPEVEHSPEEAARQYQKGRR